jgi:hypothetical protein
MRVCASGPVISECPIILLKEPGDETRTFETLAVHLYFASHQKLLCDSTAGLLSYKCLCRKDQPGNSITIWDVTPYSPLHIVAYRQVAKLWLCKQRPFLGNSSVNTFQFLGSIFLIMQQLDATIERLCFLCGSCRDFIRKGQSCQLSSERVLYWRLLKKELVVWVLSWKSGCEEKTICDIGVCNSVRLL